jgi:HAD superfamily hydrolase (TIGR01509 family)
MFKNKKVILFDLDGTLIDSVGIWNEVDRKLIRQLGGAEIRSEEVQIQRDTMLRQFSSDVNPYLRYCEFFKEKYNSPLPAEEIVKLRYEIANDFLKNEVEYKRDVEKLLAKLKAYGFTLIITTTSRRSNVDIYRTLNSNIIKKAPLDQFFSNIYTREDVTEIKPNPEIYYKVMGEFNVRPEECLIFEDSLIGVDAANRAGIEVVAMYDKYSDHERKEINEKTDYEFDHYAAVLEVLEAEL